MSEYTLGQPVTFTHPMHRGFRDRGKPSVMRAWIPDDSAPARQGIIIGKRTLNNGHRRYDDEAGYYFEPVESFTAYLVAFSMHNKPVHVLPEHLAPADGNPPAPLALTELPGQTAIDL